MSSSLQVEDTRLSSDHASGDQSSSDCPSSDRRSRLTLREMFLLVTLCGVFLGTWKLSAVSWIEALRVTAALIIVIGIVDQIRDLVSARQALSRGPRAPDLLPQARGQIGWQIAWRIGLATMAVYFALLFLVKRFVPAWFAVPELSFMHEFTEVGWELCLLFVLLQARRWQPTKMSVGRHVVALIGVLLTLVIGYFFVRDRLLISFLVFVAITGVQLAQPTNMGGQAITKYDFQQATWDQMARLAPLAAGGLALAVVVCWLALYARNRRTQWLLGLTAMLLLAALVVANVWAQTFIWSRPFILINDHLLIPFNQLSLLLITLLAITAGTAALLRDSRPPEASSTKSLAWQRPFGGYLHQQGLSLLIFLVIGAEPLVSSLVNNYEDYGRLWGFGIARVALEAAGHVLYELPAYLSLLLIHGAAVNLFRWWQPLAKREQPPLEIRPLRWRRALTIWLFLAVLLFTTASTLHWLAWMDWMMAS